MARRLLHTLRTRSAGASAKDRGHRTPSARRYQPSRLRIVCAASRDRIRAMPPRAADSACAVCCCESSPAPAREIVLPLLRMPAAYRLSSRSMVCICAHGNTHRIGGTVVFEQRDISKFIVKTRDFVQVFGSRERLCRVCRQCEVASHCETAVTSSSLKSMALLGCGTLLVVMMRRSEEHTSE